MHYLDNSATTPVLPQAAEMALRLMREDFGNPSSQHRLGIVAAGRLKAAREQVAEALGALPQEVVFTSGGTESTNMALRSACHKNSRFGKHIVSTELEHAATRNTIRRLQDEGFAVTWLRPDADGHVSEDTFRAALREDTILASCMLVNNEVGSVLPVAAFGAALRRACPHALFHVDAVQGLFRLPLTPKKWNCDLMSVSGHKIGAPKGVGALYMRHGVKIPPLLCGGGQENGLRSGTEAMPSIAAFGEACRMRAVSRAQDCAHVADLCAYTQHRIAETLPFAVQNGKNDVPHVLNYSFTGCKSEVMLRLLESEDVYVSAGSACSKGHASPVLRAMGLPGGRIDSALRISFAPFNTREDVDALVAALRTGAARLRRT